VTIDLVPVWANRVGAGVHNLRTLARLAVSEETPPIATKAPVRPTAVRGCRVLHYQKEATMSEPTEVWGVDLCRELVAFSFPARAWRNALLLARQFGWDPMGPEPREALNQGVTLARGTELGAPLMEAIRQGTIASTNRFELSRRAPPGLWWPTRVWRSLLHPTPSREERTPTVLLGGWEAAGPAADYGRGEGRLAKAADVAALADALRRALPEIPERDPLRYKGLIVPLLGSRAPLATWGYELAPGTTVTPADEFGGPRKRILRGFIRFCELGRFEIW
jgi:hypothetical protein